MKTLLLAAAIGAALTIGVVFAQATPGTGIAGGPILARGKTTGNLVVGTPRTATVTKTVKVKVKIRGKTYTKKVKVKVKVATITPVITCTTTAPCDTAVQQVTINSPGSTGWHVHPGATFVAVAQGEGTMYHAGMTGCPGEKYATGTGFYQSEKDNHVLRNEGTGQLVIYAFYFLPANTPNTGIRVDQPQPSNCPSIP